jgi:hypothetical protein
LWLLNARCHATGRHSCKSSKRWLLQAGPTTTKTTTTNTTSEWAAYATTLLRHATQPLLWQTTKALLWHSTKSLLWYAAEPCRWHTTQSLLRHATKPLRLQASHRRLDRACGSAAAEAEAKAPTWRHATSTKGCLSANTSCWWKLDGPQVVEEAVWTWGTL